MIRQPSLCRNLVRMDAHLSAASSLVERGCEGLTISRGMPHGISVFTDLVRSRLGEIPRAEEVSCGHHENRDVTRQDDEGVGR